MVALHVKIIIARFIKILLFKIHFIANIFLELQKAVIIIRL